MPESRRRLAAIMFTDLVGYSALAQKDEATALEVLERHNRLLRPIFSKHGGREVKTVGDAFLVEFDSALDATRCALEIQQSLHDYNASAPEGWEIRVRIGIHVGDVVQTDHDVLGDAVNIASRIQPLAEPGGICLTQQVYDQVQNKVPTPLVRMPPVALKNIRVPLAVYKVVQTWEGAPTARARARPQTARQIAVLPLANISPDPNDGYFADGLTEELISELSHVPGLDVIARTSVLPYKSAAASVSQIGADLGVDTVLEGSVRKAGKRIRISLQLIDVATQRHIWANSYNREIDDVFAVQADIAARTAEALQIELGKSERGALDRRPTPSPAAYDLYLRGLVMANDVIEKGPQDAARYFDQATKLDPSFADAFAAWANVLVAAAGDSVAMRDVMPQARELAARALALDPDSSDAHSALANIAFQMDNDWARADAEFRKAIALNPSNVTAYRFYGLLLLALRRFEPATEVIRTLIRLDPGGHHRNILAWAERDSGNVDAAYAILQEEWAASPDSAGTQIYKGIFLFSIGRRDEAAKEAAKPLKDPTRTERFDAALLNALVGNPQPAREVIAEAERGESPIYVSATDLAMLYGAIGEKARALDLLEQDYRDGNRVLWLWYRGNYFDSIRDDSRFVALLHRYGLPVEEAPKGVPRTG